MPILIKFEFLLKIQIISVQEYLNYNFCKILIFAHGIKTNARSLINSAVTPDVQPEENIVPAFGSFELRSRRVVKSVVPETKY